jgi:hypothetical protein
MTEKEDSMNLLEQRARERVDTMGFTQNEEEENL